MQLSQPLDDIKVNQQQDIVHFNQPSKLSLIFDSPDGKLPGTILSHNSLTPINKDNHSSLSGFLTRSQTGLGVVIESRFADVQKKQDQDLERWKRKLQLQKQHNDRNLEKQSSLDNLLHHKSNQVIEI